MRQAVYHIGIHHVQPHTQILDLGCSRGESLALFDSTLGLPGKSQGIDFIGLENSDPMIAAARDRFKGRLEQNVQIRKWDLRNGLPPSRASLIFSILTLQFVPVNHRQKILSDAHEFLVAGGALVVVEKVIGNTVDIDENMVRAYHWHKADNEYTQDQIERKRLALEGVLVPMTARANEDLLRSAGFSKVDCFWRWMNFAGWVAVK